MQFTPPTVSTVEREFCFIHADRQLTLLQDFAKVLVLAGAIPAAKTKLVLAFPYAQLGALGDLVDDLWLSLAQLCLFAGQPFGLPADAVGVHDQRTPHCPVGKNTAGLLACCILPRRITQGRKV